MRDNRWKEQGRVHGEWRGCSAFLHYSIKKPDNPPHLQGEAVRFFYISENDQCSFTAWMMRCAICSGETPPGTAQVACAR